MSDPRIAIIEERLKNINNIIAVSSGKGGVGKSLIASSLSVTLTKEGYKVGLFDLDFTSPSTHIILDVGKLFPEEKNGVIPPRIHGLEYMSIIHYTGEYASPLRGADISNALIELLAITRWSTLDFLIIDMPPGISDATLDIIRFVERIGFLVITTPSKLAFVTVKKLINLLSDLKVPIIGVIENMKLNPSRFVQQQIEDINIEFLGGITFDTQLEEAIGDVKKLVHTEFSRELQKIVEEMDEAFVQ